MKVSILGLAKGKTTQLIFESHETNNVIVCYNLNQCQWLFDSAKRMDKIIPYPISYSEFVSKQFNGRGINGFLIDNAEQLLKYIAGNVPINHITINQSDIILITEREKV